MIKKLIIYSITVFLVITFLLSTFPISSKNFITLDTDEISSKPDSISSLTLYPSSYPELLTRIRTQRFVNSTRYSVENENISIDQIYYRLASIKLLDINLGNLSLETKNVWTNVILSFQNVDGGFGAWLHDSSSILNTFKALKILDWLDSLIAVNTTQVENYIEQLRNQLTNGYNSNSLDTDSDILSTYYAVASYNILGKLPVNVTDVAQVFFRAQNLDGSFVPASEIGGFGLQTNNEKAIYWTSKITNTRAAVSALKMLNTDISDTSSAVTFIQNLQSFLGGYVNDPYLLSISGPYTANALESLTFLGATPLDITYATDYILSLETIDGSFKFQSTSTSTSLKSTYYALLGLSYLNSQPSNILLTLDYLLNWLPNTDGFGASPGELPTLRETFDAVSIYVLTDKIPDDIQSIIDYVISYRNIDGGYGITGSFTESTLRALEIYNLLGIAYPNSAETISFLQSLQQTDGGFSRSAIDSTSYVVSTFRATRALEILHSVPLQQTEAITYSKNNQNADGGYGGFIGDNSDVTSSYRAVRALKILNSNPSNIPRVISFLKNSQNLDGGFKRSTVDIVAPKNISSIIYSYSATRALLLLDEIPNDVTGLYTYIKASRNRDGGYGKHPNFTSDIAYTFVSLWILRNFNEISQFSAHLPQDIEIERENYDSFNLSFIGGIGPHSWYLYLDTNQTHLSNGTALSYVNIAISTAYFDLGVYILRLVVLDQTETILLFQKVK